MNNKLLKLLKDDEMWLFFTDEGSDRFFKKYISNNVVGRAAAFIAGKKHKVLVSGIDEQNLKTSKVVYNTQQEFDDGFKKIIETLNYPEKIYLNYSSNAIIDVLGHGNYLKVKNMLKEVYAGKTFKIASSEELIYKLEAMNTKTDEKYFRLAAKRAHEILEKVFPNIKVGMTEKAIATLVKKEFAKKPDYFKSNKIVFESYSWEEPCPIVLVGDDLALGGHTAPGLTKIKRGNTVYFDFGVKLQTAEGKEYCSDIQRMGYMLNKDEKDAPKEIKDIFNTLVEGIQKGIKICSNKTKGYRVDEVVRGHILKNGYPDYNHGTGHPVSDVCHGIGTRLSRKGVKDTNRYLVDSCIYTIEPRIMQKNGGSIEEMIIVKGGRAEFISPRQKKLYLIRG